MKDDMIDIVERLREWAANPGEPLVNEAADEIEHLRAEIERLRNDPVHDRPGYYNLQLFGPTR